MQATGAWQRQSLFLSLWHLQSSAAAAPTASPTWKSSRQPELPRGGGAVVLQRSGQQTWLQQLCFQLCSGGEFNFLLVFSWWVFQLLKKQSKKTATNKHLNSNICITERRLLRLRKGPGHSPHSCDKGVGEQTGPGALAERTCAMLLPDTKHVCIYDTKIILWQLNSQFWQMKKCIHQ